MGRVARAIEGRIARAFERRIHARADRVFLDPASRAGWERHQRAMDLAEVAEDAAASGLTDNEARDRLGTELPSDREAIDQTIAHLASQRTSYLMDRAFRLLTAARNHDEVKPIDPLVRDQCLAEARIGRLALEEAFAELLRQEPRLGDYAAGTEEPDEKLNRIRKAGLVGARASDPLLHTELAEEIVYDYLRAQANPRLFEPSTPVFELEFRTRIRHLAQFGGDPRPRASN
jgi:hypothetical protein